MVVVNPQENLSYYLDNNLHILLEGLQKAVLNHNTSAMIIIDGRSGMGKSTFAFQIGNFLSPNFSLDNVHFSPKEFLEGLARAKKGDTIIFDEAMAISSRSALSELNRSIVRAMAMIRSKQIFVIFCVNSIFDLDRNLALSRADLLLHVAGDSLIDRGHFLSFFKPKGNNPNRITQLYLLGKKLYSYSRPRCNFYGKFIKKFVLDEDAYEKKKQIAINKFLFGEKTRKLKRDKALQKAVFFMKEELKIKTLLIAEKIGLSKRTIHNLLNEER